MALKSRTKLFTKAALAVAMVSGLAVAAQPLTASANIANNAQAAAVTVTPSTGLADGAAVSVAGSGLRPTTVYDIAQCAFVDAETLVCNWLASVTPDNNGNSATRVTVGRTFDGKLGNTTIPWGTVDCTAVQCFIGVGAADGHGSGAWISFQ